MESSLDIADEPKITITEVYDTIDSQQLDNSKRVSRKTRPYTQRLLHKLYDGGLFNPYKFNKDRYAIDVHPDVRIWVPTWIDLDQERSAIVKAELADRDTKLPEAKIFAQSDTASDTARRLAISVTVFKENGSKVQFWANRRAAVLAGFIHDLVVALEALQEETATELSH